MYVCVYLHFVHVFLWMKWNAASLINCGQTQLRRRHRRTSVSNIKKSFPFNWKFENEYMADNSIHILENKSLEFSLLWKPLSIKMIVTCSVLSSTTDRWKKSKISETTVELNERHNVNKNKLLALVPAVPFPSNSSSEFVEFFQLEFLFEELYLTNFIS